MFERTQYRNEEHVDERAYKFFSYQYGRDGHQHGWNSLAVGLSPTSIISAGNLIVCAYCGRRALPIQQRITSQGWSPEEDYANKGYCCVCKDAMDEVAVMEQMSKIQDQMYRAIQECKNTLPAPDRRIVLALIDWQAVEAKNELEFFAKGALLPRHVVERAGFELKRPSDKENW